MRNRSSPATARAGLLAVLLLVTLAFGAAPARAHDPHEITADVHFVEDRLEVMLTQMHLTALAAASLETTNRRNFNSRQFEEVKTELEAGARRAVEVETEKGPLAPTSVAAVFTRDGEIEFRLTYPRPEGAWVKLKAALLRPLGDGPYVVEVTVLIDGNFRGQHNLRKDQPKLKIDLSSASNR